MQTKAMFPGCLIPALDCLIMQCMGMILLSVGIDLNIPESIQTNMLWISANRCRGEGPHILQFHQRLDNWSHVCKFME